MVGLAGLSVPLAAGDGASGAIGPAVVGAFRGPNVIVVDEALLVDRVRLLLAKVSERKKQLLIARMMAVKIRQFDFLISICICWVLLELSAAFRRGWVPAEMI